MNKTVLIFLLFALSIAANAQEVQKYPFPGPYNKATSQGMAVYEDALFLLNYGGHCRIYDLKTGKMSADFDLESAFNENLCNSASFGIEFPEGNREFPAFYVSEWYGKQRCFVESITHSGSKLIQTLSVDTNGKEGISSNWVVDREQKCLYAIAAVSEDIDSAGTRKYLVTKLPLPALNRKEVVFGQSDIIEQFEIAFPNNPQGAAICGKYLYLPVGLHDHPDAAKRPRLSHRDIIVVNLETKKIEKTIDIHSIVSGEPEDMDFYKGNIILYCGQKDGGVYSLKTDYSINSPDQHLHLNVTVDQKVSYSITCRGVNYLLPSDISMTLSTGNVLGKHPKVRKSSTTSVNKTIKPLYGINSSIEEKYNELKMEMEDNYAIVFRLYDEGFAYRFETKMKGDVIVASEQSDFCFPENYPVYFHPELSEAFYRLQKISDTHLSPNYSSLPVLIRPGDGMNILIHESDVLDYPCMTVASTASQKLTATHSRYPKVTEPGGQMNFNLIVKETEPFIARTPGTRTFPWRIVVFAASDKDILNNEMVYLLASESKIKDESWIKPGKASWDWWNELNLWSVPFKTGVNTETYKYFIDFASKNNIEYVILDAGWSDYFDLMKVSDNMDMPGLISYAREKNVGIFLWCVWRTIDRQMEEALNQFGKWGVAGLKVDFMDRDDQIVVNFQERLLRETAKRKMLVDYHGAYHPTGICRTYPNHINVEGVRGLEYNKFNPEGTSPGHAVTLPFIRMFAGSMDYTPGAMENYNRKEWRQINDRPMSQGTRCHQLAMYVVYYAPLQMLADAPTAYERDPEYLQFLSEIPVVWDETLPLESSVGEYVAIARRKGSTWYVGAMTDWNERTLEISLHFLDGNKNYKAEYFSDGINAGRVGNDYKVTGSYVKKDDKLFIRMAEGGGFVARYIVE
jgi:alpha-glucosidase